MQKRMKMRSGAKFFLFLIVLLPIAYIAASYIKGEDGIQNFKELLGLSSSSTPKVDKETYEVQGSDLKGITDDLTRLETENAKLREELYKCQQKSSEPAPGK